MTKRIIDSHVHVWDLERIEYQWLKNDTSILNKTYSIEELSPQISKANVTDGILVQAANNSEDTDMLLEVAKMTGWIKGVVGWLPLMDPAATEKALTEKYVKDKYFRGCRHLIHNEADPKWLLQEAVLDSLQILAEHDLTYDVVGVNTDHLQTAIKVAEKIPGLKMVLDHLNQPPIGMNQAFGEWADLIKIAAQHKNFYAKISGLGTTANKGLEWTKDDLKPSVVFALNQFGTDRCFCGGDWPVSLLAGPYEKAWHIYQQIFFEELEDESQQKVLFKNAELFYNLPPQI